MKSPRLEMTGRGLTVFDERYLYSRIDPRRRPAALAREAVLESHCLYIIPSPLLAYGIPELIERISHDSHILAFEVSQQRFKLCSSHIEKDVLSNRKVSFLRVSDTPSLEKILDDLGPWRFRKTLRIDLNAGSQSAHELYEELCRFISDYLATYWRNRYSLQQLGRNWIKHIYANILSAGSHRQIESSERPVIVIGAGPSLESVLDFLKSNQEKLTIWATDTAVGTLLESGIDPDLICVMETQAWNHLDFHDCEGKNIPFLADISSYPNSIALSSGSYTFFSSQFTKLNFLRRISQSFKQIICIPALGSVGLAAVYMALKLNSGPVLLAGLDFAYKPGKTHARGSSLHRWQLSKMSRTRTLPGWNATMRRDRAMYPDIHDRPISSDRILIGYAELFRSRFATVDRLRQLSGGLDIAVNPMSLDEVKDMIRTIAPKRSKLSSKKADKAERIQNSDMDGRQFLRDEKRQLEFIIKAWDAYAAEQGDAESVVEKLKEMDHIYCDFPDEPPLPNSSDVFLVRAVSRTRYLLRCIEHLL